MMATLQRVVVEQDGAPDSPSPASSNLAISSSPSAAAATAAADYSRLAAAPSSKRLRQSYVVVEEEDDDEGESSNSDNEGEPRSASYGSQAALGQQFLLASNPSSAAALHRRLVERARTSNSNNSSGVHYASAFMDMVPGLFGGDNSYTDGQLLSDGSSSAGMNGCEANTQASKHQLIKGERRYPCGFPGCKWVFTRSNHVLRHHQRVHPGFNGSSDASASSPKEYMEVATLPSLAPPAGPPSQRSPGSGGLFVCDFPNCSQKFKTLTLLTRHKRYVHLMIAIQEQMSYIAASKGIHPDYTPKPYSCEVPTCVKTFARQDHVRRHIQQSHPHLVSPHTASKATTSLYSEEPISELEPEVLLHVDESKIWSPNSGPVDLHPPTYDLDDSRDVPANGLDDDDDEDDDEESSFSLNHDSSSGHLHVSGSSEGDEGGLKPKRPYRCDVNGCDKAYTKHSHLVRHKVETHKMQKPEPKQRGAGTNFIPPPPINLQDRPFVCDYPGCRWSFKRQYHLDRHFMTHRMPLNSRDGEQHNGPFLDSSGYTDDDMEPLASPNIITSSRDGHHAESKGTSLLSPSPQNRLNEVSQVPRFNWSQLVKDKLISCDFPDCGLRFKSQLLADQHYYMTHSGPSVNATPGQENKKVLPKQSKTSSASNEVQISPLANSSQQGKSNSLGSAAELSLLKKPSSSHSSDPHRLQDLQIAKTPRVFSQFQLLNALTRNGSSSSRPVPRAIVSSPEDDQIVSASNYGDEDEDSLRNNNWAGRQRKPREKGIFQCDIPGCSKKFGRNCELTRHKLNHMDVWPFKCDWPGCERKFKRKDVFKNHQRTHRKEDGVGNDDDSQEIMVGNRSGHLVGGDNSAGQRCNEMELQNGEEFDDEVEEFNEDDDEGMEYEEDLGGDDEDRVEDGEEDVSSLID